MTSEVSDMLPNPFDDRPTRARAKATITCVILIAANIGAWAWAWIAFAHQPVLLGTALLAYMYGLRHAFDPDHIAAIDNVVRKLMQEGKAPHSVGFFFSLGHSTIVVLATVVIAVTTALTQVRLDAFHEVGGVIGTTVSAAFLLTIGAANLFLLKGLWSAFTRARRGEQIVDEDLNAVLAGRGLMMRLFRSFFRAVSRSWHMYPIGFLFGLGFDTATEIGLLAISAAQAAQGMSYASILIFPALFTAGMSLMDTTDSVLMTRIYGWALVNPMRKIWYNLTMTIASVIVAVFIGGLEALGLIAEKLDLDGGIWGIVDAMNGNLANLGYAIFGIFATSWIVSTLVYQAKGYGELRRAS